MTCLARDGAQDPAQDSTHRYVREEIVALDDSELADWLMGCIAEGSDNFLCAVAEAAIAANAEDYIFMRPTLLALRRKYDTNFNR
ncbi:MAG TPA: hypothetical protein VFU86_04380 [Terriglobales bacterium]|nr:hypothetical protein [Terriglobales bacterium]